MRVFLFFFLIITSCTPSILEFQTAKTLGKGKQETTPLVYFSAPEIIQEIIRNTQGEADIIDETCDKCKGSFNVGIKHAYGIMHDVDVSVRAEFSGLYYGAGIGMKTRLIKNTLALHVPFYLTSELSMIIEPIVRGSSPEIEILKMNITPSLLYTYRWGYYRKYTNTIAIKYIREEYINEGKFDVENLTNSGPLHSFGITHGWSLEQPKWSIRPEIGVFYGSIFKSNWLHMQAGIGFSRRYANRKNRFDAWFF